MRCITKGEEINHIYQGHFGDTPKEKRQSILSRLFHFNCCCVACVRNYPLASALPQTYSEMVQQLLRDQNPSSYVMEINRKIDNYCFLFEGLNTKKSFKDMLITDILNTSISPEQKVANIFKILDDYHTAVNEQLYHLIEEKNIDGALQLYSERLRVANLFIKPPHMFFLSGRAALTDCLWVKYGNKSYNARRAELFGTYM